MIKVLFLINDLGGGGAEKVLVNLVNKMDRELFDITLRTLVNYGINREFLKRDVRYESVFPVPFRGLNYIDKIPGIYHIVAHGHFDVIVVYMHGVLTRIVSRAPKYQKTICYLHANMENSPFMKKIVRKNSIDRIFGNYNRIVAVSKNVMESFIKMTGISSKVCVKYNTFDVEAIQTLSNESVQLPANVKDNITLCSVGKIEEVKGYIRMLPVLSKLHDEGYKFHWIIVGNGSQRKHLEEKIVQYRLQEHISLLGFQNNPYKYLAHSDWFICASYSEGFSSVVAESLILGIPVLTTECNGMREMLGDNNEFGIIVNNSEEGLYEGLRNILGSSEVHDYYKVKAEKRAEFFYPENTVKEVEKMIDDVMYENRH